MKIFKIITLSIRLCTFTNGMTSMITNSVTSILILEPFPLQITKFAGVYDDCGAFSSIETAIDVTGGSHGIVPVSKISSISDVFLVARVTNFRELVISAS